MSFMVSHQTKIIHSKYIVGIHEGNEFGSTVDSIIDDLKRVPNGARLVEISGSDKPEHWYETMLTFEKQEQATD